MIALFKKLPLYRKILAIMLVIMVLTTIYGGLLNWFSGHQTDAGYDSPFQGVIISYAWISFCHFLILFVLNFIFQRYDNEIEDSNYSWYKTDSPLTPFGLLIAFQFIVFVCWFAFMKTSFVPQGNVKDPKFYLEIYVNGDYQENIYWKITAIFSLISTIIYFVPHLFNRYNIAMRKIESTEKKIDELSNQIKDLSEQLKNR